MFSIVLLVSCGSESAETVQENKYEVLIENSCGFDKDVINQKVYAFASDIDADNALEKIMKLTGLPPNFEIKSANVDNACAVVECDDKGGCKRIIYYNQEFIEKMNDATNTDYTELAILAHEIGHHLSGHTITEPKNRHEEELEADKFAGFILHQLGASVETAKNVFSYFPEKGSKTHPPKAARVAAITNGWYDSKRKGKANAKSNPTLSFDLYYSIGYGGILSENTIEYFTEHLEMSDEEIQSSMNGNYIAVGKTEIEIMKSDLIIDFKEYKKIFKNKGPIGQYDTVSDDYFLKFYNEPQGRFNKYNYPYDNAYLNCSELGPGWRLPTPAEISMMYKNRHSIGGFADDHDIMKNGGSIYTTYWASDEIYYSYFDSDRRHVFNFNENINYAYGLNPNKRYKLYERIEQQLKVNYNRVRPVKTIEKKIPSYIKNGWE